MMTMMTLSMLLWTAAAVDETNGNYRCCYAVAVAAVSVAAPRAVVAVAVTITVADVAAPRATVADDEINRELPHGSFSFGMVPKGRPIINSKTAYIYIAILCQSAYLQQTINAATTTTTTTTTTATTNHQLNKPSTKQQRHHQQPYWM